QSGAWMFRGRSDPNVGPRGPGLPSPAARGVAGAHDLELGGGWRRRLPAAGRDSKVPPRRGPDGLHALPRVPRGEDHLARLRVEAVDAERRDDRGGAPARKPDPLAPARAVAKARRSDEVHALFESV